MEQNLYAILEKAYLSANINKKLFGSTNIKVSEGSAEISLDLHDDYFHGMDALHGAVYFKLLDDAAFFAANSTEREVFLLTTSFHIQFFRPIRTGTIISIGKLIHKSNNLFTAKSVLYDKRHRKLGEGTGQFAKSNIPLPPMYENDASFS